MLRADAGLPGWLRKMAGGEEESSITSTGKLVPCRRNGPMAGRLCKPGLLCTSHAKSRRMRKCATDRGPAASVVSRWLVDTSSHSSPVASGSPQQRPHLQRVPISATGSLCSKQPLRARRGVDPSFCPGGGGRSSFGGPGQARVCLISLVECRRHSPCFENLVKPLPDSLRSPLYRVFGLPVFPSARTQSIADLGKHAFSVLLVAWSFFVRNSRVRSASLEEAARERPCQRPWPPARVSRRPQFHCLPRSSWPRAAGSGSLAAGAVWWSVGLRPKELHAP